MLIISLKYGSIVATILFISKAVGAPGLISWPWFSVFAIPLAGSVIFAVLWAIIDIWSKGR